MFFLMLYVHIQACLWYYIVRTDEQWIPPLQYVQTDLTPNYIWTMPIFYRYWISIYTSLLQLMGNEHVPKGWFQVAFTALANSFGAIILANLFGQLTVLVNELRERQMKQLRKVDRAKSAMANLGLPVKQ